MWGSPTVPWPTSQFHKPGLCPIWCKSSPPLSYLGLLYSWSPHTDVQHCFLTQCNHHSSAPSQLRVPFCRSEYMHQPNPHFKKVSGNPNVREKTIPNLSPGRHPLFTMLVSYNLLPSVSSWCCCIAHSYSLDRSTVRVQIWLKYGLTKQ